jgi:TonB family protein
MLFLLAWVLSWQTTLPANPGITGAAAPLAKDNPAPALADVPTPHDAKERLELAAKTNGLAGLAVPWHLKATFQLFGDDAKVLDTGAYEEWRANAQRYRVVLHGATGSREIFGTERGIFMTNATGWGREALSSIKQAVEQPAAVPADLNRFRLRDFEEKTGSTNIPCTELVPAVSKMDPEDVLCFAPTNAIVVFRSNAFEKKQTLFDKFSFVRGQTFAREIRFRVAGQLWLQVHVEQVEGIAPAGMDALTVPANAVLHSMAPNTRGITTPTLRKGADPVYPLHVQKGLQGTVFVSGTIGTDGRPRDLEAAWGPEPLRQSALDCVQKWIFNPAQLDGKPVPVEIRVKVDFRAP